MILPLLILQAAGGSAAAPPETPLDLLFQDDGKPTVNLGGRLMIDYGAFTGDSDFDNGAELRRARLRAYGNLATDVTYKLEYDFASGEPVLNDATVFFNNIGPGRLQVGHQFEPYGFENHTSSRFITFLERSLINGLDPNRNQGLVYSGKTDAITWSGGFFLDSDSSGATTNEGSSVNGRFVWRPIFKEKGKHVLHFGVAGSYENYDKELRYRQRPENHLADSGWIEVTIPDAEDGVQLGGEFAYQINSLHVSAEFKSISHSTVSGMDPTISGYSATVGYIFTGESRGYSTSNGSWTRLKPDSNALEGGLGAWEAALRYSSLDLTEAGPVMKADAVTAGLNWYLTSNTRLQSNIILADIRMEQDTIFAVRLSFDF